MKSSKGLVVVFKNIESSKDPNDIKEALKECGYDIKTVVNFFIRNKVLQQTFTIELNTSDL